VTRPPMRATVVAEPDGRIIPRHAPDTAHAPLLSQDPTDALLDFLSQRLSESELTEVAVLLDEALLHDRCTAGKFACC
jgi:hypothetical protein